LQLVLSLVEYFSWAHILIRIKCEINIIVTYKHEFTPAELLAILFSYNDYYHIGLNPGNWSTN